MSGSPFARLTENIELALKYSARGGHTSLVQHFMSLLPSESAINLDSALCGAARGGHIDLIELFLERSKKGPTLITCGRYTYPLESVDLNLALYSAARGGHADLIEFLISKGASDLDAAISGAARGCQGPGHAGVVGYYLAHSWTGIPGRLNKAIYLAAEGGHTSLVRLLISKGADDLNSALCSAARKGHVEVVQLLISKGADDLNSALCYAAREGHVEVVQLLISKGASDVSSAFYFAKKERRVDVLQLLISKSANELNPPLHRATRRGHAGTSSPI